MKTTLVVPVLDEIIGMKQIMPRVKREWVDEILVIDAGDDGSFEWAAEQGYRVLKQKSEGLVGAYREAVAAATGDVILTFSPDGNSVPEVIPGLVAKMREGYDMVIASRYCQGAKSEDDDVATAFGNWMFTMMINVLFSAKYTDTLVMMRAWKKELFPHIPYKTELAGTEPYLCILCAKKGLKVADIPGNEPKRLGGYRKMSPLRNGSGILYAIIREFLAGR